MLKEFESADSMIKSVNGWYPEFKSYVNTHFRSSSNPIPYNPIEKEMFDKLLTQFLFSPNGSNETSCSY